LPVRGGELPLEAVAELGAHVGHGWPLHGQGLLGGQPAELEAQQVAALPAGHQAMAPPPTHSTPTPISKAIDALTNRVRTLMAHSALGGPHYSCPANPDRVSRHARR
jgi:hypothetical protein